MYREETLQEEKERISNAFASIEDGELLKEVLKFALSVSHNPLFKKITWNVIFLLISHFNAFYFVSSGG